MPSMTRELELQAHINELIAKLDISEGQYTKTCKAERPLTASVEEEKARERADVLQAKLDGLRIKHEHASNPV